MGGRFDSSAKKTSTARSQAPCLRAPIDPSDQTPGKLPLLSRAEPPSGTVLHSAPIWRFGPAPAAAKVWLNVANLPYRAPNPNISTIQVPLVRPSTALEITAIAQSAFT
ncbi:hypothetical protein MPLA_760053 [Mesorhizobium sp. ORS 3359]|nr:hypothetical protein MPLA_760053 [Mesorhizobium sp. ORS 3359]